MTESTEPTPSTPAPDSFAAKLKTAREAAGLSQNKAATLAGVAVGSIQNWEHGRTKPSPQKQGAVLRKLREAVEPPKTGITHLNEDGTVKSLETVATPEELAHDPHEPVTEEPPTSGFSQPENVPTPEVASVTTIPGGIPVGNVHTTAEGVQYRRLADEDDREGAELIDGRKWFTIGFVAPHPRAKASKLKAVTPEAPQTPPPATPEPPKAPTHTQATPEAPKPVESPIVASAGQRGWAFWNS